MSNYSSIYREKKFTYKGFNCAINFRIQGFRTGYVEIPKDHPNSVIYAGLQEDWGYTSGKIFDCGTFYNGGDLYDQSKWATPILDVDGEEIECWTKEPHDETGVPKWWGRGAEVKNVWDFNLD